MGEDSLTLKPSEALKLGRTIFGNLIRYPLSLRKKVFWSGEPQCWFGLTDHPLDRDGGPISDPFTTLRKLFARKASCVLRVSLRERRGNSFFFHAQAYNVYLLRGVNLSAGAHRYRVGRWTPCRECTLRLDFLRPGAYRLRLARGGSVPEHDTEMVVGDISTDTTVLFQEMEDRYRLTTDVLRLDILKTDFRMEIRRPDGRLITETGGKTKSEWALAMDSWPLGFLQDRRTGRTYGVESFLLQPGECVYGFGEKFSSLDKVGQNIGLWNCEGIGNTTWRAYKHVPFFLSTSGYGVFVNESKPVHFWVGTRETCKNVMAVEGDLVDYYFFAGSPKEILDAYTELTGKPPVPPKWSFGAWMSRVSYRSREEVLETASRLRSMRFPCDVLNIDVGWFDQEWKCDWKFSRERFPDPAAMFAELEKMHFKVCLWQAPYVVDDMEISREAREAGALAENHGPFFFTIYPAHAIDFSRPEGVRWYKEQLRPLLEMGAAAIKVDFGEGIERHMSFARFSGAEMHNLYPLLYHRAAFEITEEVRGKGEGIVWARSAYAGGQRYPVHWSGDNSSTYQDLLCSLRGGLSLGLCGFTFWAQDCGGFTGTPDDKLYVRFTQLCVFNSHIRYHGGGPRFREPWNYQPWAQELVRKFLELRYRLIPYIYSEARHFARHGWPLLCPLVLEFPEDPNAYHIDHQFLFGRNLLVAPILTPEDRRLVYLPEGGWYDFWSGELHRGPRWLDYPCPIERIPLFLREGAVLPLGPAMQYVGEKDPLAELTLVVCPGPDGSASYDLEDEGATYQLRASMVEGRPVVEVSPDVRKVMVVGPGISSTGESLL
ncbi:MAG: glycoside hydrolase family 31 protein [Actinobacteria bacterium]|nr:glycoside hydrolase family 31 protein [Actinomycetota bacterium]